VGPVTLAQGERRSDVLGEVGDLADVLEKGSINRLLVGLANLRGLLLL
jgi:hypothetical protein